jgi:predicted nucleotidyltransferase
MKRSTSLAGARESGRDQRSRTATAPIAVADVIEQMVRIIVERFRPERIILFGSHARGTARPDSDVDLLVVMPVKGSKREKMIEIGVALQEVPAAKDVIVTTPEDFEWRKEIPGTIERPAALEGKVLYARA